MVAFRTDERIGEMTGKLAGDYRVGALLDEGGMGQVYEAKNMVTRTKFAFKVMTAARVKKRNGERRFRREARLMAAVQHPNVCSVHDFGLMDSGAPYIVMERLYGETLRSRLARELLSVEQGIRILDQVLLGLDAAHAVGIIHRDISPQNVFLTGDPYELIGVKVLDFGLSKRVGGARHDSALTEVGALLGTPAYMPPELLSSASVDARGDIYGCGLLLFEILTGRPAFHSPNLAAMLKEIATGSLQPLSHLRPELPKAFDDLVSRATALSPRERFSSAREMRAAILALPPVSGSDSFFPASVHVPRLYSSTGDVGSSTAELDVEPASSRGTLDPSKVKTKRH
jgi:serine/threonine-protein kinase